PRGYPVPLDDALPLSIGLNQTVPLTGVTAASHTVVLSGVANTCSVTGGTSRTVTVPAGGSVTASFAVSCATPTGTLNVTTSTSGTSQDLGSAAFRVGGGTPEGVGLNKAVPLTGVTAASHTVVLSGVASTCTVTGGTSRTVTVPAGGSVTASFAVSCSTPTGTLNVTTSTSGTSQ